MTSRSLPRNRRPRALFHDSTCSRRFPNSSMTVVLSHSSCPLPFTPRLSLAPNYYQSLVRFLAKNSKWVPGSRSAKTPSTPLSLNCGSFSNVILTGNGFASSSGPELPLSKLFDEESVSRHGSDRNPTFCRSLYVIRRIVTQLNPLQSHLLQKSRPPTNRAGCLTV
jgi:hypothetical protein